MDISSLPDVQLKQFLLDEGFSEQVSNNFQENEIDGALFCEMTEEHMKEVAPKISDRIKLKIPGASQ